MGQLRLWTSTHQRCEPTRVLALVGEFRRAIGLGKRRQCGTPAESV